MNAFNESDRTSDRTFFKIASCSTALAFGFAFGALQALDRSSAGFVFHFSIWTLVAALVGAAMALGYWKIVMSDPVTGNHSKLRKASVLLGIVGVAAFLYPLRFVSKDALLQIGPGLAGAVVVASTVVMALLRIKKFLDEDEARATGR